MTQHVVYRIFEVRLITLHHDLIDKLTLFKLESLRSTSDEDMEVFT